MFIRAAFFFTLVCTLSAATDPEVYLLKRLALADSEKTVLAITPTLGASDIVYVEGLPLLQGPDFSKVITPFIGKPIGTEVLNNIGNAIAKYAREHDRLITKVLVPNQNVADGTLRLVVVFGRFNEVAIRGNRWFSSKMLQERLGIKPGDEIRLSVLEDAVNWANTNPFRQVKVFVDPINNQPGKANLLVGVQEALPWRFTGSVDNYGTKFLGQWHYSGAVQAGNLWGLDHIGSYMFVTTDNIHLYQAHVASYRVPLPWRHFIETNLTYIRINAAAEGTPLSQSARNEGANIRYTVPIRNGNDPVEVHAGLDFKRGNNFLYWSTPEFQNPLQVRATEVDTFEFSVGASMLKHDKHGGTAVVLNVNASPGGIDSRNSSSTYNAARFGSNPEYVYGTLSLQRAQSLGKGWELNTRLTGQLASTNLQGSEQLAAGGPTSVRGFTTNIYAADEGIILNNDLLTPTITTSLQSIGKKMPPLQTRFAAFYDVADVRQKHPIKGGLAADLPLPTLDSAGVGVRTNLSNTFSLTFDYGWQITHLPEKYYGKANHGYGHIKVVLAF